MTDIIQSRFSACLDPEYVRKTITVRPDLVPFLEGLQPLVAAEVLSNSLKQIFIPNQFALQFINEIIGRAYLRHCFVFDSEVGYISRIYTPPEVEVSPICLTGLAGVGKSRALDALRKVMPAPSELYSSHYNGAVTLLSHWYASARGKVSGKSLLADFIFSESDRPSGNLAKLLVEVRRRANRDGVSLVLLDETQHINTGLGSAKVTDILLTLAAIGPPVVYVCNYSLVHKLLRRNSEDKQRLLSEPRIMLPDLPGSKDWSEYVDECIRVSGGCIRPGTGDFAGELYRCTFGLKRLAVQLLKQAYVECRSDGRHSIELPDLARAYRSAAYTSNASEVEELHKQAVGNRQSVRLDLDCPFELPAAHKSNIVQFAKAERDERVAAKVFDSSLTEAERAAKKHLEVGKETVVKKRTRQPAAEKVSEDEQAKAFYDYLELANHSNKSKKPS
jgi:hypothetical protein